MTRAADRLIVCGSVGERAAHAGCWYRLIEQGLEASGELVEEVGDFGTTKVRRFRKSAPEVAAAKAETLSFDLKPPRPDWLSKDVPSEPSRAGTIRPSAFVDDPPLAAPFRAGEARQRALLRGNLVHRLMQSLPDMEIGQRAAAARHFLARQRNDFTEAEKGAIADSVLAILADPRFAELFGPGSRAEVPIVGRIEGSVVNGVVDRLVIGPVAVLIADYKTNRPAPTSLAETQAHHAGYVRQLALYRAVLSKLYPRLPVRAALVWTELPGLAEIPAEALDAAIRNPTPA
jgi:ATP-dependent helicase/nuclease subunit A